MAPGQTTRARKNVGRNKNKTTRLSGSFRQVAYFSLALMALPVLGLWACTKWVLLGFHEKHELANDAASVTTQNPKPKKKIEERQKERKKRNSRQN